MSDMPERIWAWYFLKEKQNEVMLGGWDNHDDRKLTEYRRADLPPTREQIMADERVQALVEALDRQADNMAFVLNHMETKQWYVKFTADLESDRTAIDAFKESP